MTDLEKLKTWLKNEIASCKKHRKGCCDDYERAENNGEMIGYERALWCCERLEEGKEIS